MAIQIESGVVGKRLRGVAKKGGVEIPLTEAVVWVSSDPAVLTVEPAPEGPAFARVLFVGPGLATVTATYKTFTKVLEFEVLAPPPPPPEEPDEFDVEISELE